MSQWAYEEASMDRLCVRFSLLGACYRGAHRVFYGAFRTGTLSVPAGNLLVWCSGSMFGDTKKLPKGAPIPDAKRVKRYRQENPGATIVDAINAINRQDGVY